VDGLGVLHYLAAGGSRLPVVAMSADHERLVGAVAAGADATLTKPFELDSLLGVVARWSSRA
jgi:CheY-like chemotaxis protein